jgi:hypothetical protein
LHIAGFKKGRIQFPEDNDFCWNELSGITDESLLNGLDRKEYVNLSYD